jgi:hypothetical protein
VTNDTRCACGRGEQEQRAERQGWCESSHVYPFGLGTGGAFYSNSGNPNKSPARHARSPRAVVAQGLERTTRSAKQNRRTG